MQNCKGADYNKISELDCLGTLASHQKKRERLVHYIVAGNNLLVESIEPLSSTLMVRIL